MVGTPETPIPAPVANFSNIKSLEFDGSAAEGASTLSGVYLPGPTGCSYSLWMNATTPTLNWKIMTMSHASGNTYELLFNGTSAQLLVYEGGTTSATIGSEVIAADTWYHICITSTSTTLTGGDIYMYVNGALVGSGSGTTLTQVTTVTVAPVSTSFDGQIDEIAIWDAPLSAAQVTALYNNGKATDVNNIGSALKIWWRMGDFPDDIAPEGYPTSTSGYIYNNAPVPSLSDNVLEVNEYGVDVIGGPASYDRFQIKTPANSGTGLVPRVLHQNVVALDTIDTYYISSVGSGPDFSTAMTICCFIKFKTALDPTAPFYNGNALFGQLYYDVGSTPGWGAASTAFIFYTYSGHSVGLYASDHSTTWNAGVTLLTNELVSGYNPIVVDTWYHLAATIEKGGVMTGYVDGTIVPQGPRSVSASFGGSWSANRSWGVGAWRYGTGAPVLRNSNNTTFADIEVENCQVFDRVLSQPEIATVIANRYDRPDWSATPTDMKVDFKPAIPFITPTQAP